MISQITKGINIIVRTKFRVEHSTPEANQYVFTYQISIENNSTYTVQLLRRHWHIFDSNGIHKEVEGEGVIGKQPIITPNDTFTYESACILTTDMGKMSGTYQMLQIIDKTKFDIDIPEFQLIDPIRLS